MSEPSVAENAERLKKLITGLHAHFESLTQQKLTLSYQRMLAWDELINRGYAAADVALVVRWIRSQMGRVGSGYSQASLQFSRLIQDADIFEDRLNLAKKACNQAERIREYQDDKSKVDPAPRGWADWVTINYPKAVVPGSFAALPDYVQAAARKALVTL